MCLQMISWTRLFVAGSHVWMIPPAPPAASREPSGENARDITADLRCFRVNMRPSAVHVPHDHLAGLRAARGPVAGGVEGHVIELADVPVERLAALAGACVPEV